MSLMTVAYRLFGANSKFKVNFDPLDTGFVGILVVFSTRFRRMVTVSPKLYGMGQMDFRNDSAPINILETSNFGLDFGSSILLASVTVDEIKMSKICLFLWATLNVFCLLTVSHGNRSIHLSKVLNKYFPLKETTRYCCILRMQKSWEWFVADYSSGYKPFTTTFFSNPNAIDNY